MKRNHFHIWIVLIAFVFGLPAICAAQSVRVSPLTQDATLTEVATGNQYQAEANMPEGPVVAKGNWLVQGPNFALGAYDKSSFSLAQTDNVWTLSVTSGKVDFSLPPDSNMQFVCGGKTYQFKGAGEPVKGSIDASTCKFASTQGKFQLAVVGGAAGAAGVAGAGGAGATVISVAPAGGILGGGTAATAAMIGLPVVGAGAGLGAGLSGSGGSGQAPPPVSPF